MRAARGIVWALALALVVLLAGCTAAPGSLLLSDQTESLDRAQVEAAAAPLLARGATVAVLVNTRGDASGAALTQRLDEAGLLAGGEIVPDVIALYVSYEPRYSELRAGTRWSKRLPDAALREARTALLNPALRDDQPDAGVVATLHALEARIASPPLIDRLLEGIGVVMLAGFALAAIAISPLGEWLSRWWYRSPPGRLALWLGDQTPPGRRRLERIIRGNRLRLEDRVRYARAQCQTAVSGPQAIEAAALMARLRALDQQRAAVAPGAPQSRRLMDEIDRLAWAYEALGHEASRLAPAKTPPKSKRKKGAAAGHAFIADTSATTSSASGSPASDSSSTWDSGSSSSDSGPSSDGGSW